METTVLADTTNTIENASKKKVAETKAETQKKNRIQVSSSKKPLFFYLNLAKRFFKQHKEVELSALGTAIPTVVLIAEILKSNGLAIQKKVLTSTVGPKDDAKDAKGRRVQKAKIEIVLERTEKAEKETAAAKDSKVAADELMDAADMLKNLSIKEGSADKE
ncbi:uncharacterized protein At2g34160-like [Cornus florida]|uniref:uncharacterized protein At2g34160-like n=1 Tax=Cornus florida TaxID=4283 RepID=UPI002898ECCA|nr:uncharacterized protein At2g34160-like [Cornus florida]